MTVHQFPATGHAMTNEDLAQCLEHAAKQLRDPQAAPVDNIVFIAIESDGELCIQTAGKPITVRELVGSLEYAKMEIMLDDSE